MYTNQQRIEAFLQRELTDQEAEYIDETIESVSKAIEDYTGRSWEPILDYADSDNEYESEDSTSARLYDGTGSKELFIDDFINLEQVRILDALGNEWYKFTLTTDWQTFPSNSNPKNSIRLTGYHFPLGYGNIEVTAQWGGGRVPNPVITIATQLVANYLTRSVNFDQAFKKESIEGYSYELSSGGISDIEIQSLMQSLDTYKRILL